MLMQLTANSPGEISMACRIEVGLRLEFSDPSGDLLLRRISDWLGITGAKSVRVLDVYTIDEEMNETDLNLLGRELFSDSIIQS